MRNLPSSSVSRETTLRAPRMVLPSSWTVMDVVWKPRGSCSHSFRVSHRRLVPTGSQKQHKQFAEPVVPLARPGDSEHLRQVLRSELEEVLDEDAEGGHHLATGQ